MLLQESYEDLTTSLGVMRAHVFMPEGNRSVPGLLLFSEIYQVTPPIQRIARMLAGGGYLVVVPEIYHEFEPPGTPFKYDQTDTDKGNRYKTEKTLAAYDEDARVALDFLKRHPRCSGRLGSFGVCIGGHLSFRAAMNPDVLAAVCCYATDIHKRSLGKGTNDNSLDRIPEIKGEVALIWGRQDPHIPLEGRQLIYNALTAANTCFSWHEFNAQHAFLRDEGHRYNPALSRICYQLSFELFERVLK